MAHVPVLLHDVLDYLDVRTNEDYIDATIGRGGYARALLGLNAPRGRVLGIDWDEAAIDKIQEDIKKKGVGQWISEAGAEVRSRRPEPRGSDPGSISGSSEERLLLAAGNFKNIASIARSYKFDTVAGVVFDLGLRSDLIESSGRGFSYLRDEPLIMSYQLPVERYQKTAKDIVNAYEIDELTRVFREYGEIRQAGQIAEAIVERRAEEPILRTTDLRRAVEKALKSPTPKILAQVWQAIRIEVNNELGNLEQGLRGAWKVLAEKGRLAVVSFHSLEDRRVKNFFREQKNAGLGNILTKKPVVPSKQEISTNPRARSAKLRAIEKNSK